MGGVGVQGNGLPPLTLAQLCRRVKDARFAAGLLQRLFQSSFYHSTDGIEDDLRKQALALQRDFFELEAEYAVLRETDPAAAPATKAGGRLATNFAKLEFDVKRVVWYEEDLYFNARHVKELEDRAEVAEAQLRRYEARNAALVTEVEVVRGSWFACTDDNLALRDEVADLKNENAGLLTALADAQKEAWADQLEARVFTLEAENAELKKVARHNQSVEFYRDQLKVYMERAACDERHPATQVRLLKDGNDAQRAKAVRVLGKHAKRAPKEVAATDGALGGLVQVLVDESDLARAAATVLVDVAEADGLALFMRVPDIGRLLHGIARDEEICEAALPQLVRLVRLLTLRSGGGVLESQQQRMEFANVVAKLWSSVGSEGEVFRDLMGAVANLAKIDPFSVGSKFIVDRVATLTFAEEPCAEVLVAVRCLTAVPDALQLMMQRDPLLACVVRCMSGEGAARRSVRIEAARALAALAAPGPMRARVVDAHPLGALRIMAKSKDQDEYEQAMRTLKHLIAEDQFCQNVMICDTLVRTIVERVGESGTAFALLAALLMQGNDIYEDCSTPDIGDQARCQFLTHVTTMHPSLKDVVNKHLFSTQTPKRREDAIRIVCVLASNKEQARVVAATFLPAIESYIRNAKTPEEQKWSVTALAQLHSYACSVALVTHPGVLHRLIHLVNSGVDTASKLLVSIMQDEQAAKFAGGNRGVRLTLLTAFTSHKNPVVRDRSARALALIYKASRADDRDLMRRSPEFLKSISDMSGYKPPEAPHIPNGAVRLTRYLRRKAD